MFIYFFGFLISALTIFIGAKITYRQVLNLAEAFNVPPFLVSLLLVAFSTSTPELFVGVSSALQHLPAFSLGDVLGSNIINLTFIAGLVVLISKRPVNFRENIPLRQLLITFSIASVPVFMILDGTISRGDGIILVFLYTLYVRWILQKHKKETEGNAQAPQKDVRKAFESFVYFLVGIAFLVGGSEAIITIASAASKTFSIAPFALGVFAVAFSTSLPEIMFGIRVAMEQQPELSIGDLVGSSAVNATGILGIVAIIYPITPIVLSTVLFTGFFGILVFILYFLSSVTKEIPRIWGVWLLMTYFIFVSFNFIFQIN